MKYGEMEIFVGDSDYRRIAKFWVNLPDFQSKGLDSNPLYKSILTKYNIGYGLFKNDTDIRYSFLSDGFYFQRSVVEHDPQNPIVMPAPLLYQTYKKANSDAEFEAYVAAYIKKFHLYLVEKMMKPDY